MLAINLDAVKRHLSLGTRQEHDDFLRDQVIPTAIAEYESDAGRQLITASLILTRDRFPRYRRVLLLPKPPLQSVTSITYLDTSGDETEMDEDDYIVNIAKEPGEIQPVVGVAWPSTYNQSGAVVIEYVAGYGDEAVNIPSHVQHALLEKCRMLFERRDDAQALSLGHPLLDRTYAGDEWCDYG